MALMDDTLDDVEDMMDVDWVNIKDMMDRDCFHGMILLMGFGFLVPGLIDGGAMLDGDQDMRYGPMFDKYWVHGNCGDGN